MIGGRLKATMVAVRICWPSANMRRIRAWALSAAVRRSSKGFSLATMKPEFDELAPSSSEKPITANTSCTCGMVFSTRSIWRAVSLVRDTEAPSGSWMLRKKAPWSSSGRKEVGVIRASPKMPPPITATASSETTATRIRRCTMRA